MDNRPCLFCDLTSERIFLSSDLCYARWDRYPVNRGHALIIPARHFADYFDATRNERAALWDMVDIARSQIKEQYGPDGFNVGINVGAAAGQSVLHLHIHLIPRYAGDMENPKGGVRGVIPGRQKY